MTIDAIQTDATTSNSLDLDEAAALLSRKRTDAETPSRAAEENKSKTTPKAETKPVSEDAETPSNDTDEDSGAEPDTDTDDDSDEGSSKTYATDETLFKVKVLGEEKEVTVKELAKYYGRDAALTQKEQAVAETRRRVEDEGARAVALADHFIKTAEERWQKYAGIDWHYAAANLPEQDYIQLREEATWAANQYQYATEGYENYMQQVKANSEQAYLEQCKVCAMELMHPETGIPGFDEKLYRELVDFAINVGKANPQAINTLADPAAYRIIHMAYQYHKGKTAVAEAPTVKKTATKVIKSSTVPVSKSTNREVQSAMNKLMANRDTDSAAAVLAQRRMQNNRD